MLSPIIIQYLINQGIYSEMGVSQLLKDAVLAYLVKSSWEILSITNYNFKRFNNFNFENLKPHKKKKNQE
jgi:hypothetical protein